MSALSHQEVSSSVMCLKARASRNTPSSAKLFVEFQLDKSTVKEPCDV